MERKNLFLILFITVISLVLSTFTSSAYLHPLKNGNKDNMFSTSNMMTLNNDAQIQKSDEFTSNEILKSPNDQMKVKNKMAELKSNSSTPLSITIPLKIVKKPAIRAFEFMTKKEKNIFMLNDLNKAFSSKTNLLAKFNRSHIGLYFNKVIDHFSKVSSKVNLDQDNKVIKEKMQKTKFLDKRTLISSSTDANGINDYQTSFKLDQSYLSNKSNSTNSFDEQISKPIIYQSQFGRIKFEPDFLNVEYFGNIHLGTPPQPQVVSFTTLATNLWIFNDCAFCQYGCSKNKNFSAYDSSTYAATAKLKNKDLCLNKDWNVSSNLGTLSKDTLAFTPNKTLNNITFAETFNYNTNDLNGIFGLSTKENNCQVNNKTTPLKLMYEEGLIGAEAFSINFNSTKNNDTEEGELLLGPINYDMFEYPEKMNYHNIYKNDSMVLKLDSLSYGDASYQHRTHGLFALTLIESQMIFLNPNIIKLQNVDSGYPCEYAENILKDLTFTIDNINYTLKPKDYMIQIPIKGKQYCFPPMPISDYLCNDCEMLANVDIILGKPFIQKFYTHFDIGNKRIGFYSANIVNFLPFIFGNFLFIFFF